MDITTMTTNAASCVLSVRPRPALILTAVARAQHQGTAVSVVALQGRGLAAAGVLVEGTAMPTSVSFDPDYKPTDVVRSFSGRPPV